MLKCHLLLHPVSMFPNLTLTDDSLLHAVWREHLTIEFPFRIQMRWNFCFAIMQFLFVILPQIFVHASTAISCGKFWRDHYVWICMNRKWYLHWKLSAIGKLLTKLFWLTFNGSTACVKHLTWHKGWMGHWLQLVILKFKWFYLVS